MVMTPRTLWVSRCPEGSQAVDFWVYLSRERMIHLRRIAFLTDLKSLLTSQSTVDSREIYKSNPFITHIPSGPVRDILRGENLDSKSEVGPLCGIEGKSVGVESTVDLVSFPLVSVLPLPRILGGMLQICFFYSLSLFHLFSSWSWWGGGGAFYKPWERSFFSSPKDYIFLPWLLFRIEGGIMMSLARESKEAGRELHVLAVDDSSVDLAVIARLLRSSKHRVTTVDSGKRALELLDLEPNVNMIITDYWMPEMTGYDLLKKIKESSTLKGIPVVIMSSENVPNRIHRCLEEGAEDFLLKPVRPSDVSRVCSRVM